MDQELDQAINRFGGSYTDEHIEVSALCIEALLQDGVIPVDLEIQAINLGIDPSALEVISDEYAKSEDEDDGY